MRTRTRIIVVGVVCCVLAVLLYWVYDSRKDAFEDVQGGFVALGGVAGGKYTERTVPDDAREYRSEHYGFSILYPKYLEVKEYPGADDTMTLTFQNIEKPAGFQMFILPYSKPTVDRERFRKDVPSGVQKDVKEVTLAGASGAAFYSKDLSLGDTYEVWIIHNGRLFEITTLAPLDEWLQSILSTWQFI